MQAFRKIASALIVPTIACLGTACERTATPTEPSSVAGVAAITNERDGSGTTRWVNNDPSSDASVRPGTSCNDPGYTTVQAAVTAADPGDRINVCPGTYREQVTIPSGKDGIRLRSVERWQAIIKAPAVMLPGPVGTFTIVRVDGAQKVSILAFTITGPGPAGCGSLHYGVRVDDGGSANILGNHITDIRDQPFSGCQNGVGIQVGRLAVTEAGVVIEATRGSARIIGNVIDHYQKNGMTVSNAGSSAEIANNQVSGAGPTAVIAQNGIQVSGGATATVRNNFVANGIYTPQDVVSTGILLFQSGKVVTDDNTVISNDVGIYMLDAGAGSITTDNHAKASTFDGITIDISGVTTTAVSQGGGSRVAGNKSDHNGGPGISVFDGAHNNTIEDNTVEDNKDSGILLDLGNNNVVSKNEVNDNGTRGGDKTDGIRINAGSGNTIRDNRLKNNVTHDCHEGSTGNRWTDNRAETSFPRGLCGDKDRDEKKGNVHTESILQLQSAITASTVRRATVSPDQ